MKKTALAPVLALLAALALPPSAAAGPGAVYMPKAGAGQTAAVRAALTSLGGTWMAENGLGGLAGLRDHKPLALMASWVTPQQEEMIALLVAQERRTELVHIMQRVVNHAKMEAFARISRLERDLERGRVAEDVLEDIDSFTRDYAAVYSPYQSAERLTGVLEKLKAASHEARSGKIERSILETARALELSKQKEGADALVGAEQMWGLPYQYWSDGREPVDRVAQRYGADLRAALAETDIAAFKLLVRDAYDALESELRGEGLAFLKGSGVDRTASVAFQQEARSLHELIAAIQAEFDKPRAAVVHHPGKMEKELVDDGMGGWKESGRLVEVGGRDEDLNDSGAERVMLAIRDSGRSERLEKGAPMESFEALDKPSREGWQNIDELVSIAEHYQGVLEQAEKTGDQGYLAEAKRRVQTGHYAKGTKYRDLTAAWDWFKEVAVPKAERVYSSMMWWGIGSLLGAALSIVLLFALAKGVLLVPTTLLLITAYRNLAGAEALRASLDRFAKAKLPRL